MFGSIAHNHFKPGKREEFMRMMQDNMDAKPPGAVQLLVYTPDSNPDELWLAIVFESREAYQANSESPEMQKRFAEMQDYMARPPEWHDGEVMAPWA